VGDWKYTVSFSSYPHAYQFCPIDSLLANSVPDNVHQLHVQQPSTYEKPEAASAVLGS